MAEKLRLPQRQKTLVQPSVPEVKPEPLYKNETFQFGVILGIVSTIAVILFCLIIIGLIGAILS